MSDSSGEESEQIGATRVSRRSFGVGALLGGLGTVGLATGVGYKATRANPYQPRLERVAIPLPPAHSALAGLTIGFVADTHLGPHVSPADVARALALLGPSPPDLVLLGGDYVSASPRYAEPAAEGFAELVDGAPLGGFAVLGNHDCGERGRAERVTTALEDVGIRVLRNESAAVDTGRGRLWIVGVDEAIMARADPAAAFARVPTGAAALALWHEPDYAEESASRGAFVQLSGHSHGGQVRLPGFGPMVLPLGGARYVMGVNRAAGMPVYTTRGVGVFMPPIRLNCPPEVTLITLEAPTAGIDGSSGGTLLGSRRG